MTGTFDLRATSGALSSILGRYTTQTTPPEPPPPVLGAYAHLAPQSALAPMNALTGLPMPFNPDTGLHDGTVMNSDEPVWATTIALTDTGNPVSNFTTLQAEIDARRTTITGHTLITLPTSWRGDGHLVLRPNTTAFTLGLRWADGGALPPMGPSAVVGDLRPTKANRPSFATHWAPMPRLRSTTNGVEIIRTQGVNPGGYFIRGLGLEWRQTAGGGTGLVRMVPDVVSYGTDAVESATSTSVTMVSSNTTATVTNMTLWIQRGTGAGQIRTGVTYNGATRTYTIPGGTPLAVIPDSTSRVYAIAANVPATTPAQFWARDIVLAQCLFDGGGAAGGMIRAVFASGERIAQVDCVTRNLGVNGQDSQDMCVYAGAGPFKYVNNDSEIGGPKENWLSGGFSLPGNADEFLPRNCEIRFNRLGYAGYSSAGYKCSVEVKYGRFVLIEANSASNQGAIAVNPFCEFVVKLTDQGGDNAAADTQHVMVRMNEATNSSGIAFVSSDEFYSGPNRTRNVDVIGNVQAACTDFRGIFVGARLRDVAIDFNTVVTLGGAEFPRTMFFADASVPGYVSGPNIRVRYNVIAHDLTTDWVLNPINTFNPITTPLGDGAEVLLNLLTSPALPRLASQITVPSLGAVGFVDRAGGNVALAPASPGYRAGPGGVDIGAAAARVAALMAEVG